MQQAAEIVIVRGKHRIRKKIFPEGQNQSPYQTHRLSKLIEYLQSLTVQEMTGYIRVNFNQGNICKVERYEEILKK